VTLRVLTVILLSLAPAASAGPKEDVARASSSWATALGTDDPDKVLPFYSEDAVLWGTLSPTVRASRAALNDYFIEAFKVLPGLKVSFGDQLIRVYGGTAVNTGYYTFSYVKDGETRSLPARYTFTYVKNGDRWLIVDHHSSAMPSTLKSPATLIELSAHGGLIVGLSSRARRRCCRASRIGRDAACARPRSAAHRRNVCERRDGWSVR